MVFSCVESGVPCGAPFDLLKRFVFTIMRIWFPAMNSCKHCCKHVTVEEEKESSCHMLLLENILLYVVQTHSTLNGNVSRSSFLFQLCITGFGNEKNQGEKEVLANL